MITRGRKALWRAVGYISLLSWLGVLIQPAVAFAGPESVGVSSAKPPKEKIIQQREYEGSIRGLRALMSDLKSEKPDVYNDLKADFEDLDTRQTRANVVYWSSLGAATGIFAYGIYRAMSPSSDCDVSVGTCESKFSFYPFLGAVALYYGGTLTAAAMAPSRQEYLNFTNKHNRRNPDSQLQWNSSLRLMPGGGGVQFALSF